MMIPKEIIDNSEGNKLISFLNNSLKENPKITRDELADVLGITSDGVKYHMK